MRSLIVAYGLSILSASVCLFFGDGWMGRTLGQALVIVMFEGLAALAAAAPIELLSRRLPSGGARLLVQSVLVSFALGPVAGALMCALPVISLRENTPESLQYWTDMIGVTRMYSYAGFIGGGMFWVMSGGRRAAPGTGSV